MVLTLNVLDVWKEYNGNPVLKGCSISFDKRGIYVLMGPNGSGKSTFLRLCALLENPDGGKINYFSTVDVIRNNIELKRRITLVLPRVGVFNTTVFKNVVYGLKIRGTKSVEAEEKANRVLEFVGLMNKKNQNALTLSSGEAQRLGIARALVIEPDVLFLDEPTASVDQENTEIIENIILNMKNEGRSTVIITTHDMLQAERLAGKVFIMQNGKVVESFLK